MTHVYFLNNETAFAVLAEQKVLRELRRPEAGSWLSVDNIDVRSVQNPSEPLPGHPQGIKCFICSWFPGCSPRLLPLRPTDLRGQIIF